MGAREREASLHISFVGAWKAGGLYTDLSSVRCVFYCWAAVRKAGTDWQCSWQWVGTRLISPNLD
jgi:hypothetical protein